MACTPGRLMREETRTWKTCHASPGDIIPQITQKEKRQKRKKDKKLLKNSIKTKNNTLANSISLYF
jgi:hypothetical protein